VASISVTVVTPTGRKSRERPEEVTRAAVGCTLPPMAQRPQVIVPTDRVLAILELSVVGDQRSHPP